MGKLLVRGVTDVDIDKTRSGYTNGWTYTFKSTDDAYTFGSVSDNSNGFSQQQTSPYPIGLQINITKQVEKPDVEYRDTLDMDYLDSGGVPDNMIIYLPRINKDSLTLYVGDNGRTYYDENCTQPAIWQGAYTPEESSWSENN